MARERAREDAGTKRAFGTTGSKGREKIAEEVAASEARRNKTYMPFRFKAGYEKGKDVSPIIFLDNSLEDAFYFHIHEVMNDKGNFGSKFEVCLKEQDNCPLCNLKDGGAKNIGHSTYVMCLTVLDLTPYTSEKDGKKKTVSHSRKLFMVKGGGIQDWIKVLERAEKRHKGLRGVYIEVGRNSREEAATGKPLVLEENWYREDVGDKELMYDVVDEKDLLDEYGHNAIVGQDGKRIIKEADADTKPYDYAKVIELPDENDLAKRYGLKSRSAGSQADIDKDFDAEESPRRGRAERTRSRSDEGAEAKGGTTRRRSAEPEDEPEEKPVRARREVAEETVAENPPRRTKQREAHEDDAEAEEKPRSRTRRAEPEDEPEAEEKPARRTRGKAAEPEAEDEPEDDAPKARTRVSSRAKAPEPEAKPSRRTRAPAADINDDEIPF